MNVCTALYGLCDTKNRHYHHYTERQPATKYPTIPISSSTRPRNMYVHVLSVLSTNYHSSLPPSHLPPNPQTARAADSRHPDSYLPNRRPHHITNSNPQTPTTHRHTHHIPNTTPHLQISHMAIRQHTGIHRPRIPCITPLPMKAKKKYLT